jgi:hypothetical protein
MADVDAHEINFQCPNRGHELKQTIGRLKSEEAHDLSWLWHRNQHRYESTRKGHRGNSEGNRENPLGDFDQVFPLATLPFSHASDFRDIHSVISSSD